MNVFRRELKTGLRPLLWWGLGLIVFIAASAFKFSTLTGDTQGMAELMAQLPAGLQGMLGAGTLDFTTAIGFYGMMFPYLLLLAAAHAAMLGAGSVSREEREKATEFLYAKPVSRVRILTQKLLSMVTLCVLLNVVNTLSALGMLYTFHENATRAVLTLAAWMMLAQLVFAALGAAAAAAIPSPKVATGVAAGVMLGAYGVTVELQLNANLGWLRVFTPFSYFDVGKIVAGAGGLGWPWVLLCIALTVALTAFAYLRLDRRDLRV